MTMTPHKYHMKSSQIAKHRLLAIRQNEKTIDLSENNTSKNSEKSQYIQNPIHIDNNLLWEEDHNALSSKGD